MVNAGLMEHLIGGVEGRDILGETGGMAHWTVEVEVGATVWRTMLGGEGSVVDDAKES